MIREWKFFLPQEGVQLSTSEGFDNAVHDACSSPTAGVFNQMKFALSVRRSHIAISSRKTFWSLECLNSAKFYVVRFKELKDTRKGSTNYYALKV